MPDRIDLPAFASALGRAMHDAGIAVTPERSARFAQALSISLPDSRRRLYWTARTVFVSGHEQLAIFDRVFASIFDRIADPADARGDQNAPSLNGAEAGPRPPRIPSTPLDVPATGLAPPGSELRDPQEQDQAGENERDLLIAAASSEERLAERDFGELEADELRALRRLMHKLALTPPVRRVRRFRRDHHGRRLDLRATLRGSYRTGGDPARPVRRERMIRPRRLVLLCDISGSMEPYTRAFLMLLHAAVGAADAEAFVFATRLTRLTRALRGHQPDLAIERAAAAARDWSGGTRLGDALQRFNDEYGRRGMARGAVVVIISDGWERGDPALVGREMQRLRRLAYRVVWVNPRKAGPQFAPLAGGMAAALPYCDAFVSGHSARALSEVADAIAARC
jgi:uncharacterized protein with von Willebrand factor type A (vWA) domain